MAKKNNVYYLCQQTKKNLILDLNNLSLTDIKNNNIIFCEDILDGEVVSSTVVPTDYSIRDKKLADLLETVIFNDMFWVSEDEYENIDLESESDENKYGFNINNVIDKLLEDFLIVRYDNKDKKYSLFTKEQIKNSINQIIDLNDKLDEGEADFNIINTLDDDVVNSLTVSVNAFIYEAIPKCMGKFNEGIISITILGYAESWQIIKDKESGIKFGLNDYQDMLFRAKMYEYLCFESTGVLVSIKSDSKLNNVEHYYEHYGFKFNMGEIIGLTAKGLYDAVKESDKNNEGSVFCDINGERIIGG